MINLEDMKRKLNQDLQKEINQEACDSGRLKPEDYAGTREEEESIIDTPINFDNLTPENIEEYIKTCPVDEKGRSLVPDEVFDKYYRILPESTRNESKSKQAVNRGYINVLGNNPERDKEIQRAGAEALNAKHAQRRTMSETIDILLRQSADPDTIQALNLPAGATKQDALLVAIYRQATEGNVKAGQFLRDTIGEQPTTKQDLNVNMTEDDKKLLEKVEARLNS